MLTPNNSLRLNHVKISNFLGGFQKSCTKATRAVRKNISPEYVFASARKRVSFRSINLEYRERLTKPISFKFTSHIPYRVVSFAGDFHGLGLLQFAPHSTNKKNGSTRISCVDHAVIATSRTHGYPYRQRQLFRRPLVCPCL